MSIEWKKYLSIKWLSQVNAVFTVIAWFLFTVGGTFFGAIYTLIQKDIASEASAAWIQAFGSVGAIWAAIGLAWWQRQSQIERDSRLASKDERNMLRSICDEIKVSRDLFEINYGKDLEASQLGTAFNFQFKIGDPPFPVFDAYRGSLGKITDVKIRKQIVVTYARAHGLIESFRINNALIDRVHVTLDIAAQAGNSFYQQVVNRAATNLENYGDVLREVRKETLVDVQILIDLIDDFDKKK